MKRLLVKDTKGTSIHEWLENGEPRNKDAIVEQVAVILSEGLALLPKGYQVSIEEDDDIDGRYELIIWKKTQFGANGIYSIQAGKRILG